MSFIAAIATGLLLWVSYPPLFFGPAVWIALIPLLAVLWPLPQREGTGGPPPPPAWWRPSRAPGAFLHGYLAGAVFFLLNLQWLHHVTTLGMTMLALYLALYPAVWALFAATIGRPRRWDSPAELTGAIVLTAAAWTGLEWLRGIALTGFGWNGLGVALGSPNDGSDSSLMSIAQWAEWVGVTGLSFFVTAHTAFWVGIWRLDRHGDAVGRTRRLAIHLAKAVVAFYAVGLAVVFVGDRRARSVAAAMENAPPLTVALIQPNILQENKNSYDSFHEIAITLGRLTQQAFESDPKPDIVVWPESSLPAPYYDQEVQDVLRQGRQLGEFTHILGIDDQELDAYFNSIAVFRGDPLGGALHRKVHLVPFGEYLPARGFFGRFDFIREQLPGDFKAGDSTEPVPLPLGSRPPPLVSAGEIKSAPAPLTPAQDSAPTVSLIPLVCFEDTLGRVARRFARPEPQLLVNVTNDAWFRDSAGADQHLANAVFRSIELRRPMIRAANTGVTAVIDPLGRITHRLPRLQEGQLTATIPHPTIKGQTLYAGIGDSFSIALLALAAAATLRASWPRTPRAHHR